MSKLLNLLALHGPKDVAAVLRNSGLEAPHGFVRGLDQAYDLGVHIDDLIRPLPEADDFRIMHRTGDGERWVFMERMPWDSAFFGYGVAKLHAIVSPMGPIDLRADATASARAIEAAMEHARDAGIRYVFTTVASSHLETIRALSSADFALIETRCHYHKELEVPAQRYPAREATYADTASLARTARDMANVYDRFHADPFISPRDADRLMERWVQASIQEGFADLTIVPDEDAPEAFCTAKLYRQHWDGWGLRLAQPILSAVSPRHKGWYLKLISEVGEVLRTRGAEHVFLTTQITNIAVLRTWAKLGYMFGKGEHVFRRLL